MKKKLLTVLSVMLVVAMTFAFTGCGGDSSGGSSDSDKVVIHLGSTVSTTHAWYEAAEQFKADVEEASGGSIELVLDFGGVYGSDKDTCEAVQNGSLEMYIGSTVGADTVVPEIGFVNLPYFVTTYDEVDSIIYDGWAGEIINKDMTDAGFHVIGLTDCDFRWMTNSKHPIESTDDIKNLKMRVPEAPMFLNFFEELGATPTSMGITEVASALQQGTIDGQDNGPVLTYTYGFHQFNKYVTKTNHSFASAVVVYNQDLWDALSDDQKEIMTQYGEAYCDKVKELAREDTTEMEKAMVDEGCEVIEVTDTLDSQMREAAYKIWQNTDITSAFDQEAVEKMLTDAGLK